jgi:hypothetical protein
MRRIVTGHNESGKSVITIDGPPARSIGEDVGGLFEIWNTEKFLSNLEAEHDFSYGFKESLAEPGGKERLAKAVEDNPPVQHPVIRIHPESTCNYSGIYMPF